MIDEPASACATAGIRIAGGATITSRSLPSAAASRSIPARIAAMSARASTGPRCIFQFPAISFLRTRVLAVCTMSGFERLDARQLAAFQEFERGSAAGRDMRELVRPRRMREGGSRVAAADYRNDARLIGERLTDSHRATGERRDLAKSERAIPDDGFGTRDFRNKRRRGIRSDVEPHH